MVKSYHIIAVLKKAPTLAVAITILVFQSVSYATEPQEKDTTNFFQKNVVFSGDIGSYGELYSISGQAQRRPPSTGRLYFRPSVRLFNAVTLSFDFLLSTEGNSARQDINQFGLNPSWKWISAHIGDFSENYSNFSLNGINIRGAGVNMNPGIFMFSAVGGLTNRAVSGDATNKSFDRYIYGGKIGIGKEYSGYFNLFFLRIKDDPASVGEPKPSITLIAPNGGDVWPIGSIQTMKWTSTSLIGNVRIEISRDGGSTFEILLEEYPNIGIFSWTVIGGETFQAMVRITSISDTTINDLSDIPFTIASAGVEAKQGNIIAQTSNPNAVTPQENIVAGTQFSLPLFQKKIIWTAELCGDVYTSDMQASVVDIDTLELPKFVEQIYTPRISTSVDYALQTELKLNLPTVSVKIGYKYLGPGYNSLGVASLINDQQEVNAMMTLKIYKFALNLNGARTNDNLIDQKLFTTSRNRVGFTLNGMLTSFWNVGVTTSILSMSNDSDNDTTKVDITNFAIGTNHSFIISQSSILRNINFNYSFQSSDNNSSLRNDISSITHNANFILSFSIIKNLNANASFGLVSSTISDTLKTTTQVYSTSFQHRALKNKLTTSLSFSTSMMSKSSSLRIALSSRYSMTSKDIISLSLSSNNVSSGKNFSEYTASISFSHRF